MWSTFFVIIYLLKDIKYQLEQKLKLISVSIWVHLTIFFRKVSHIENVDFIPRSIRPDRIRSRAYNVGRIRWGCCRIPTQISSEFDEILVRSDPNFIGVRRNPSRIPTTTLSNPIGFLRKMSDSDRFRLDLQVGLNLLGWHLYFWRTKTNRWRTCSP
jgi:hypothetical protein